MDDTTLRDKTIAILGLGREGFATYTFLRKKFSDKQLLLTDEKQLEKLPQEITDVVKADTHVTLHLGKSYLQEIIGCDIVFKSAGIPLKIVTPVIPLEKISSMTQLFFDYCPAPIIGITGTKGKSTTSTIIFNVLRDAGIEAVLCGNIGKPSLDFLDRITTHTSVVLEMSSHQLQTLTKSPHIAVLQNIVPEHLDYYNGVEEYITAKENITKFQTKDDCLIYNVHYPVPYEIAQRSKAKRIPFNGELGKQCCFIRDDSIVYKDEDKSEEVMSVHDVRLKGAFNLQNVMPAVIIGKLYKVNNETVVKSIANFKGLEDRLEYIGTVDGVDYYNDSLSTVPEATIAALEALEPNVQTLIAGGFDRGLGYTNLAKKILSSNVATVILFPTTGEKIWQAIEEESRIKNQELSIKNFFVESMLDAVKLAKEHTTKGKICLMSPASPSFGIFKDYHDRGEQFKRAILDNP